MKKMLSFLLLMVCILHINSHASRNAIEKYKEYLEKGTAEGCYDSSAKGRYYTFSAAFDHFLRYNGKIVVELGTTRSFVHGGLPGCNSDNTRYWTPNNPENWDWGAGCFTRVAAECLAHVNPQIHTVDLAAAHIRRSQLITSDFKHLLQYHICSSEQFLQHWDSNKKIDLLYLDTGDMTPIEPTALLHLREAKIIVQSNLISPQGIIVIDDIKNKTPKQCGEKSDFGKGKYSIPFFLENGFEIMVHEYQIILKKTNQ